MKIKIVDKLTFVTMEELEIKNENLAEITILTFDPEETQVIATEKF